MENTSIPFLCGGTFFTQVYRSRKGKKTANEHAKGQKESLSEPELFRRLISIYQLTDFRPEINTLKSYTTFFKRCQQNQDNFIGLDDYDKRRNFGEDIQKENSKAFSAMVQFIRDYIDESLYKQLARNLLGLIQEDSSIPTNEKFFIWPKWVEKQSLITRTEINLPDLLLGIWHYIAINRSNENIKGADTYHSWYPVNPKEYKGRVGADIKQELQVTCSNTSHQSASASVLDGENNQSSEKAYEADDSSTTEENNYSKTQIIQNATIVNQHGEKNIHITHVDTLII
ncbi:MAG: hypothetical protein KHX13_02565 [Acidaminococcus intestini]|jgi:hypothetical protein|uniref:Uncharacterized protein n=1 Tax=Acidaminococcus intestini TaxID=187327 RepID=A0A943EJ34_9FIRM|nr:hypothetical protein [Acidaminococcus intestini]